MKSFILITALLLSTNVQADSYSGYFQFRYNNIQVQSQVERQVLWMDRNFHDVRFNLVLKKYVKLCNVLVHTYGDAWCEELSNNKRYLRIAYSRHIH